jgi:hypothetical protein
MRSLILAASMLLVPAAAGADQLTEPDRIPDPRTYSERIKENLSMMSLELNQHLGKLSGEMVSMTFDVAARRGRLHLGGGDADFGLRIDSNIKFERGYANFETKIDLAVAGRTFELELPEFDMVPRTMEGERFVEIRLPLIKGTF